MPNGTFTIIRNTKEMFGGYIMAPRARILDGATGYFAGNVVAKEYAWTAYAKEDGRVTTVTVSDTTHTFIPDVDPTTDIERIVTRTTVIKGGHTVTHTVHTNPDHTHSDHTHPDRTHPDHTHPDHTHQIPTHVHDVECNWGTRRRRMG